MEIISLPSAYKAPYSHGGTFVYTKENYSSSSYAKYYLVNAYRPVSDTDISKYANIRGNAGANDILFHGFDLSSLPENVKITKMAFRLKIEGDSYYVTNITLKINSADTTITSTSIPSKNSINIFSIEHPDPTSVTALDLKTIGCVVDFTIMSGMTSSICVYGVELDIEYEESNERTLKTIPTNYQVPFKKNAGQIFLEDSAYGQAISKALTEADSDTYGSYRSNNNGLIDIAFTDFNFEELPEIYRIDLAYLSFKIGGISSYSVTSKVQIYSKHTKLYEFEVWPTETNEPKLHLLQLDGFRKSYLQDFKVVYQVAGKEGYTISADIYGMDLNLVYIKDEEEPIITETVIKVGYSKKPESVSNGAGIQTNSTPNTEGYIGNLYNDDLDDYAEFNYTPNAYTPELPEEELQTLGIIKIDSPTFTSMGVPNNAIINNVKLTKLSEKTCENETPVCELYIQVGKEKSSSKSFLPTSGFVSNVYDTGEIQVHKLDLAEDKASFILEWKSYDTPFNLRVKYLLWDVTYMIGDRTYSIQFDNNEINKVSIGRWEVDAVYAGVTKIYG